MANLQKLSELVGNESSLVGGGKSGVVLGKRWRVRVGLKGSGGSFEVWPGPSWSDTEEAGFGVCGSPVEGSRSGLVRGISFEMVDDNVEVDASG